MATPWNPIASVTSHEFLWPIWPQVSGLQPPPKTLPSTVRTFSWSSEPMTRRRPCDPSWRSVFLSWKMFFFHWKRWLDGDLMNILWCFKWGFTVTWWDCIVIFHGVGQGVKLPQAELEVSKHIYCLGLPWFTTILINDKGCIAHVYSRACFCGPFLVHQKNWLIQMASF